MQAGRRGIPLSATGIEHWRTVLSMFSGPSQSTKMPFPPSCHPPREPRTKPQQFYTAEDHKRDVLLRSTFFPAKKKVILTPLHEPPRLEKWRLALRKSPSNIPSDDFHTEVTESTAKKGEILDHGSGIEGSSVECGEIETERKGKNRASIESEQSDQEQGSFISYQIPKPNNQAMDSEVATTTTEHIESESKCELAGSPGQSVSWKRDQQERNPPINVR